MPNNSHNTSNTLLLGPIDTNKEVQAILAALRDASHLRRELSQKEITDFLMLIQKKRMLDGPVDTPLEVEIFLGMLRKAGALSGPIDTPEEVKRFMGVLEKQGLFQPSKPFNPNDNLKNKNQNRPER